MFETRVRIEQMSVLSVLSLLEREKNGDERKKGKVAGTRSAHMITASSGAEWGSASFGPASSWEAQDDERIHLLPDGHVRCIESDIHVVHDRPSSP
jgi:hypothetical protein